MSITYDWISPQIREIHQGESSIVPPPLPQIVCRGRSCRRHASTNNKLCPTKGWIGSMRMENIVGVDSWNCEARPRQTSCAMGDDAERLEIYKNPSAQVSEESITDAHAITINSQP